MSFRILSIIFLLITLKMCCLKDRYSMPLQSKIILIHYTKPNYTVKTTHDVLIENYFHYIDSVVNQYAPLTTYPLSEHLLVRANPWILDTLMNTDYYRMKAKDSFVYDQKKMIALPKGAVLNIPDSTTAKELLIAFKNTRLDVNIPEFKLRIYEYGKQLYEFPIRVGRNEKKFLEMSGRIEDLRTRTGEGQVLNYNRNPRYVNPVTNHEYFVTKRDDDRLTRLPQIPFIETEINGKRYGQFIHPTTNPETLGKAYSNGCLGTNESDAWIIYYYAPIGTTIKIRYDLKVISAKGDTLILKDIYKENP